MGALACGALRRQAGARLNVISHLLAQVPYEKLPRDKPTLPKRQKAHGGSVAKTIAEDVRTGINWIRSPLCGGIEKSGNEDRLSSDIAAADLSNLPLPDHRHRFETCQCSSGGSEPAEAEPRADQTLDAPMILLDNIIQILALP